MQNVNMKTVSVPGDCEGAYDVAEVLAAEGWEKLGSGAFGYAMAHPKRTGVLKVFTARDAGYISFIELVLLNQHVKHFPKVLGALRRFVNKATGETIAYGIRIEKLRKQKGSHEVRFSDSMHVRAASRISALARTPSEITAMRLLRSRYAQGGVGDDLHGGNVMEREDGTPVITDPWVGTYRAPSFRNRWEEDSHEGCAQCGACRNCEGCTCSNQSSIKCGECEDAGCFDCRNHSSICEGCSWNSTCLRANHSFLRPERKHNSLCRTSHPEFEACPQCAHQGQAPWFGPSYVFVGVA